ncbi:MAG: polysaccharide deacetylase family protein [Syntrophomonas sp.]|nr:polysaccharide deacetylase family protein [Syntrophomonas sp.]
MKKKYLYLFPLLIILGMVISFSLSLADFKDFKSTLEVFMSRPENIVHNRKSPVNETIASPESATRIDNGVTPTVGTVTPPPANPPVKTLSVPILMYHEIGDGPSSLYVSEKNFRAQMHYLRSNGYKIVTMTQAREMLANKQIPPKVAVITFDDGYVSIYNRAWPILEECAFPATVYVCSSFPGLYNYLTWDHIKILHSGGVEIGSHSHTHPALNTVSPTALAQEVVGSKQILEQKLGTKIDSFCYPCGAYNENIPAVIKKAGYTSAVTVNFRKATSQDDLYLLPRIRVFKADTISSFAKNIQ